LFSKKREGNLPAHRAKGAALKPERRPQSAKQRSAAAGESVQRPTSARAVRGKKSDAESAIAKLSAFLEGSELLSSDVDMSHDNVQAVLDAGGSYERTMKVLEWLDKKLYQYTTVGLLLQDLREIINYEPPAGAAAAASAPHAQQGEAQDSGIVSITPLGSISPGGPEEEEEPLSGEEGEGGVVPLAEQLNQRPVRPHSQPRARTAPMPPFIPPVNSLRESITHTNTGFSRTQAMNDYPRLEVNDLESFTRYLTRVHCLRELHNSQDPQANVIFAESLVGKLEENGLLNQNTVQVFRAFDTLGLAFKSFDHLQMTLVNVAQGQFNYLDAYQNASMSTSGGNFGFPTGQTGGFGGRRQTGRDHSNQFLLNGANRGPASNSNTDSAWTSGGHGQGGGSSSGFRPFLDTSMYKKVRS
jgi:hypothetical protein